MKTATDLKVLVVIGQLKDAKKFEYSREAGANVSELLRQKVEANKEKNDSIVYIAVHAPDGNYRLAVEEVIF